MRIGIESVFRDFSTLCEETHEGVDLGRNLTGLFVIGGLGTALYGLALGFPHSMLQGIAAMVKLPLLFLFALIITLPAFHFIGLHAGSRLRLKQTLVIVGSGVATTGILLAAFLPITVFFEITGSSYPAMVLLHVAVIGFCGGSGVMTIHRGIMDLAKRGGALNNTGAEFCLYAWMVIFAFVGTQLAWIMRPFVGAGEEFVLISRGEGAFFSAVLKAIGGIV